MTQPQMPSPAFSAVSLAITEYQSAKRDLEDVFTQLAPFLSDDELSDIEDQLGLDQGTQVVFEEISRRYEGYDDGE